MQGPDRKGIGAKVTGAIANAGINLRGLSAAAMKKKFICHLALDTAADATKVMKALKAL